jgi:serine-type D-Ala-D-Ala carboxypeptidase (penicillin-binding protein 5/6)
MKLLPLLALLLASVASHAQIAAPPPPPALTSKSFLLLDFQSGAVLAAKNQNEPVEPASLTKLMTAYVVFDALRQKRITPEQKVTISDAAGRAPGSRMFLELGAEVTVEELLHGMIVQSGNDASIALAEAVSGSEETFVVLMNRKASQLGMLNTRFRNSTGLPHGQHYSTASDMARLTGAIIREFPQYFPMYSMREYRHNNITQYNRNRLIGRDPHVDGMKTGFTESAGFCLVATAQRNDRRLISVVIDAGSDNGRVAESQRLLNYGFESFDTVRLYASGEPVHQLPVWKGSRQTLQAGFTDDFYVTYPKGQGEHLHAKLESMQPLLAPVRAGDAVGTLRLSLADEPYAEHKVVALESIAVANMFIRAWHSIRLLFN